MSQTEKQIQIGHITVDIHPYLDVLNDTLNLVFSALVLAYPELDDKTSFSFSTRSSPLSEPASVILREIRALNAVVERYYELERDYAVSPNDFIPF